jgi:hypothetical protein
MRLDNGALSVPAAKSLPDNRTDIKPRDEIAFERVPVEPIG